MSPCPTPAQRAVCTQPAKAGTRRMQCQGSPFPGYRREGAAPARRRDSLANIRSSVNHRDFHQRKDPALGCTGVRGRMVNTCIAAQSACRPESEPSRDGYAIIVRLTDGIGPLKAAYGMWQKEQARFLLGEMFWS